jgi:hypothetical protein
MPNWVYNTLTIKGDGGELERFRREMIPLDFNKITPMPPELKVTSGTCQERLWKTKYGDDTIVAGMLSDMAYYWSSEGMEARKKSQEEFAEMGYKINKTPEIRPQNIPTDRESLYAYYSAKYPDAIEESEQYQVNKLKYGHTTWYDWCRAEWGTKWNIEPTEAESFDGGLKLVHFETAGSPPTPVITRLSALYPALTFDLNYRHEDGRGMCLRYINGNVDIRALHDGYFRTDIADTSPPHHYAGWILSDDCDGIVKDLYDAGLVLTPDDVQAHCITRQIDSVQQYLSDHGIESVWLRQTVDEYTYLGSVLNAIGCRLDEDPVACIAVCERAVAFTDAERDYLRQNFDQWYSPEIHGNWRQNKWRYPEGVDDHLPEAVRSAICPWLVPLPDTLQCLLHWPLTTKERAAELRKALASPRWVSCWPRWEKKPVYPPEPVIPPPGIDSCPKPLGD